MVAGGVLGMRVLLDAHWWVSGPPSGRGILRSLVVSWVTRYPGDSLVLRVPRRDRSQVSADLTALGVAADVVTVGRWAVVPALTALTSSPRRYGAAGVVTQNFTTLCSRNRVAVTMIYDAIFQRHPEWFTARERLYFSLIGWSARRADAVVANTDSERREMEIAWPWLDGRIVVAPIGIPVGLRTATATRPRQVPQDAGPFVLAVGRLNERKNLGRLIDGFLASARSRDSVLYIVGAADGLITDFLTGREADGRVQMLGAVSDGELRWMYENADLFIFASLAEGFGMPLVEAAEFGAPSVASDIPPFREIGLARDYFDPTDALSIRDSIDSAPMRGIADPQHTTARHDWTAMVDIIRSRFEEVAK